jgi:hypothetical protein
MARSGNVGGTARAVGNGWKQFKSENPDMTGREIAEKYVEFRYGMTDEEELKEYAMEWIIRGQASTPIDLSWAILFVENLTSYGRNTLSAHRNEWKQIMSEELEKMGINPGKG